MIYTHIETLAAILQHSTMEIDMQYQ